MTRAESSPHSAEKDGFGGGGCMASVTDSEHLCSTDCVRQVKSDPILPPGIEALTLREALVRLMEWHNTAVDAGNEVIRPYIWCVCGWRSDDYEGHPGALAYAHQADAILALLDTRAPVSRPGVTGSATERPGGDA